jgi:integrase
MPITTTPQIKALKPRADRYDVAVKSENEDGRPVPGLQVRVFPSGARVFQFRYTFAGQPRRMSLGPCDALGLKLARERHHEAYRLIGRGIDPQDHREQQEQVAKQEKAKREAEITVSALVEEYIAEYIRKHHRDPAQAERLLNVEIKEKWGPHKVNELRRRDAVLLVRPVARRAPAVANDLVATIKQLFGFAADVGHLETNPMVGLRRTSKETPRERKLNVEEVHTLWHAIDERITPQVGGFLKKGSDEKRGTKDEPMLTKQLAISIKLLLVTAQRRGELLGAKWSEFDIEKSKIWTIPKERSKNGKEHAVPLSSLALELLSELKTLSKDSDYLYPSAYAKRRDTAGAMDEKSLTRAAARNQCGLAHWTPHDLRRTASSHMHRIGVDPIVVEKVLNHTLPGMLAVYNRHDYEAEKRDALDRWAAELRNIIAGKSNVVAIPKQRARA